MEKITLCHDHVPGTVPGILFQLEDGEQVLYHSTGIQADPDDAGANSNLRSELDRHRLAMCKAYTIMQVRRMDMNSRVFEMEVSRILTDNYDLPTKTRSKPLYPRLIRYIEEAHRDGIMGDGRYAVALGKAKKLHRFLYIIGRSAITVREFSTELVLKFRHFVYDEYMYVPQFPELYPRGNGHRPPTKRMKDTTVVHDLKILQAFYEELKNADEIRRSPFHNISGERRRVIMHVMYDTPICLRAEEFKSVLETSVPIELQWAKDLFVLNCAIGCRISDLLRLTMEKVAVSDEGIPYVHYIPSKTSKLQTTNIEVVTPLIEPALEIVNRTQLKLLDYNPHYGKQRYNIALRKLLSYCGITRKVSVFCQETGDNIYKPLCEVASSKLARKTHIDMLSKVQINYYVAGLHRAGSDSVFRYTNLELRDRYELFKIAFGC